MSDIDSLERQVVEGFERLERRRKEEEARERSSGERDALLFVGFLLAAFVGDWFVPGLAAAMLGLGTAAVLWNAFRR